MHGFESHVVLAVTIPHAPLELLYVKCILLVFKYIYIWTFYQYTIHYYMKCQIVD
jgi:hypothetical protein